MRVHVDKEGCRGYANCVMAAPDVFDLDDDGVVFLLTDDVPGGQEADVEEAVRSCPVHALELRGVQP